MAKWLGMALSGQVNNRVHRQNNPDGVLVSLFCTAHAVFEHGSKVTRSLLNGLWPLLTSVIL